MRKERIQSEALKRHIALKANKLSFEDVTEHDFDVIESMVFNGRIINGAPSNIEQEAIGYFPNLKRVRIIEFDVTQDVIALLGKLPKLQMLEFAKCRMGKLDFSSLNGKLLMVNFDECGTLLFQYPIVSSVDVVKSEIDMANLDLEKIESISILESTINNARDLTDYQNIMRVCLDGTKLFDSEHKEIQDIEVSEATSYSHKEHLELIDSGGIF